MQRILIHPAGAFAAERKELRYCSCARLCSSATESRESFSVTGLCPCPLSSARSRTAIVVPLWQRGDGERKIVGIEQNLQPQSLVQLMDNFYTRHGQRRPQERFSQMLASGDLRL
ncbi:hypothetical protein C5688_00175 [Methylocystis sp. MitZ-2018]|nr:hypothetical protein C5688_00175 [Methylocystis sp. MitZ-2018]